MRTSFAIDEDMRLSLLALTLAPTRKVKAARPRSPLELTVVFPREMDEFDLICETAPPAAPDMRNIRVPCHILAELTDEEYLCYFEQLTGLASPDFSLEVVFPKT